MAALKVRGLKAGMVLCSVIAFMAIGASVANAYVVRGANGRLYGVTWTPRAAAFHPIQRTAAQPLLQYQGGPVMLSSKLYLIFWGPAGSFDPTYQGPIVQWAKDLAANSGRTTNEFSVGSLYYQTLNGPTQQITRNVAFGGAISDTSAYPANACTNPGNPGGVCLGDGQLQGEIARDIAANHWPVDNLDAPVDQYLIFTPNGVDSCMDPTATSCTFSATGGYCAYHSSFTDGAGVAVYSNMPYMSGCDSGQAPSGVAGNTDTDGTLDSAIHEVIEAATDPGTDGAGWFDSGGQEIGDKCTGPVVNTPLQIYGQPLGGSLGAGNAYNQVINGHTYYTQQLWANNRTKTPPSTAAAGCVQRVGPSPVFLAPATTQHVNHAVAFDATKSYDIVDPITRYAWNYGDGSATDTTHGAHGIHIYTKAGTYMVTLTVSDAFGLIDATSSRQTVRVVSP